MLVLVNLKAYEVDPVAIGEAAATVSASSPATVAVAPQTAHLGRIVETGAETWAQHVAPIEPGSHTGHPLAEAVAGAGAAGTILNHSERRLSLADLETAVAAAERAGLATVVCAATPDQAAAAAAFDPDAVAIEPPALIGTGTPVSRADPEIVTDAVAAVAAADPDVPVYCGAGISTGADVRAARELGAEGVLLASGVAKADDPRAALGELVADL